MIFEIIRYFLIWLFCLVPILIWGYIFSYVDGSDFHSRRFLAWIIAWTFSVVPVLYMEKLLNFLWLSNIDIFSLIKNHSGFFSIFISLFWISLIIAALLFLMTIFFISDISRLLEIYIKNILTIFVYSLIFGIIYVLAWKMDFLAFEIKNPVSIWSNVFNTFFLVIIYYMIIWFLEELSKHFSFLPSSLGELTSVKSWVLLSIFIALGFWFVENILYINNIFLDKWWISGDLFSTWIFRWIFSLFVHVLCAAIVWFYFSKAYLFFKNDIINYVKIFLSWIIFSVIVHAIFDISLTLSFSWIIFIYLIFWYFYLTKLFYKE